MLVWYKTFHHTDVMSHSQPIGQQLTVDDLRVVMKELNDVCAKWNNIGVQLGVKVGRLKAIEKQYSDPSDCLRETLREWLTNLSAPTWTNVVDALNVVGEAVLAANLKQKYCLSIPVPHTSVTVQPSTPQLQASATASPPHPIVPLLSSPITDNSPDAPPTPQHSTVTSFPHSPTTMHTGKSLVAINFLAIAVSIQVHCSFLAKRFVSLYC